VNDQNVLSVGQKKGKYDCTRGVSADRRADWRPDRA